MNSQTDQELMRVFADCRSEAAFAELVRRHVDFVYSAALRMVQDAHLAEDVAQGVFAAFAQNARQLAERVTVSGWLHRTTRNLAANAVRSDVRRRAREKEAAVMNELLADDAGADWDCIAPNLDAALAELSEDDREAVLLRYFEHRSAPEMARLLGISNEAAQKRVSRAVDRLRAVFAERGVAVGAGGLALVISANAVQAAPSALAATISTSVISGGATFVATATAATVTKAIAMTTFQKIIVTAAISAAVGIGIYQAHEASIARAEIQILREQQAPLKEQLAQVNAENERLSNLVTEAKGPAALPQAQLKELMKLRNKSTVAQNDSHELAKLKSTLADFLTNAAATGFSTADKWHMKEALARVARMKKALGLSDEQAAEIGQVLTNHIQLQSQLSLAAMSGKLTSAQQAAAAAALGDPEVRVKSLLTPDQVAEYTNFQDSEKKLAAESAAKSDAREIAGDFKLTKEQETEVQARLYDLSLKEAADTASRQAMKQAALDGDIGGATQMSIELEKRRLEEKASSLEGILSPDQLTAYKQKKMNHINSMETAMKLFSAQKTATAN